MIWRPWWTDDTTLADRDGGWLDEFITGAQQRGYRVDFIAVHWYGTDFTDADALRTYLDAV